MNTWPFDMPADAAVVTSVYVTRDHLPILFVTHEEEDGEIFWQFHCGNGDYDPATLQMVGLGSMLKLDSSLAEVAKLPVGQSAARASAQAAWTFGPIPDAA